MYFFSKLNELTTSNDNANDTYTLYQLAMCNVFRISSFFSNIFQLVKIILIASILWDLSKIILYCY